MMVAKNIGLATSLILEAVSFPLSGRLVSSSLSLSIVSIMTMAPSTSIPKSIAPRLSRFAGMPVIFINMNATRSEMGIVMATARALLMLPRNIKRILTTRSIPKSNVCSTVCRVVPTNCVRSMNIWILTFSGSSFSLRSSTTLCTCSRTFEGFWYLSIWTIPSTPSLNDRSSSTYPRTPLRSRLPYLSSPRSLRNTGTPSSFLTTILPMSSRSRIRPTPRTT